MSTLLGMQNALENVDLDTISIVGLVRVLRTAHHTYCAEADRLSLLNSLAIANAILKAYNMGQQRATRFIAEGY